MPEPSPRPHRARHSTGGPFRSVLFDLDGTVWDSIEGIVRSLAHSLTAVGMPVPHRDVLASNVGPPLEVMLADHGVPHHRLDEARDAYRDRYRRKGEAECEVYPGIPELLDELRAQGVRLATATSKGVEPAQRMLERFDLARRFDVIAAASMDASAHHKIDVVRAALADLTPYEPARTALVGDRSFDVDAGRELGIVTIGVVWGYGSAAELTDHGADHVVATVPELAQLLLGRTAGS